VLSIHFRQPRAFSDRDRQLGGLVARQVADLIVNRGHLENIARLNEALSRRTTELEASQEQLSAQTAELLEQDRNKEAFLASLGHELRTPMAAIQNSLELLSAADESSQAAITVLKRQSRHLSHLVDDLLDVARINRGRLQIRLEEIELIQCVRASADSVRSRAQAKGLALELDLPESSIKVTADPARVSQILDNLLSNALDYTDHGVITIKVRSDARHARTAIRDTGIGIDPGELATIFNPLRQTDKGRRAGGLGLGLSLVKRLVEMHQGTIEFRSDGRGLGSEVTFTLPLSRSAAPPTISSSDHVVPPPTRRVLVIEDYPDTANALGRMLEMIGQQVRIAYNGEVALEIAREQRPQVAFVDLKMPGMSGAEVAQHLRREFPSSELTLVALSGYPKGHADLQELQVDHYLLKPATMENIVTLLNSLPVGPEK
jgi:signal transduction histidine kinase